MENITNVRQAKEVEMTDRLTPPLYDLREGAAFTHLSIYTLRAWIYQKRLPYVRLGRRVFLRKEDLENLIKKNLVGAKD